MDVYLEITKRRRFASAVDWPGWCRAGKTEDDALAALLEYAPRYRGDRPDGGASAQGTRLSREAEVEHVCGAEAG